MHFAGTKSSPYIVLLLSARNVQLAWKPSKLFRLSYISSLTAFWIQMGPYNIHSTVIHFNKFGRKWECIILSTRTRT